ncbi:hypothetical protein HY970_02480 [Candidatus Kaiserbacteria bacterium]|nr:hypothetical protein [Candidatus Kaiserbacteria bacterium]
MRNIQEYWLKIKAGVDLTLSEWGLAAIVLASVLASFGLGRLSAQIQGKPLVQVRQANVAAAQMALGGLLVAARTGDVYYYPWCTGAQKISPQNERWFESEEAAKRAGYHPAKNCKGMIQPGSGSQ